MSKTVDERVVSMQFDNKHFESNVQTSISTLDKLKRSLNLDGASKGLENVNSAAQKCDLSPIGKGVEAVKVKFSALEVMAVTALANITNSAINAGKNIASALTIDPVKTGFSEYETKMNAIQVIKSNTRGKNTMEEITAALDELNEYADKTIYNFSQMTSNVGKFVAQGLDVKQATNAIKGMANLAGASGASAEDMSRATYQMSQALGSSIKLIDWNSLRNANMATTELKNTLIDLAKVHGIAIDDMIEKEGAFEQTLSNGWLTGEIFTEAMNIYSGVYSDAELAGMGFTESQIKNFKELAAEAESATTDVKTFTQLWEVLKETAQSGWAQTWELIVGDFETAKSRLSQLKGLIEDPINKKAEKRNSFLAKVLGTGGNDSWTKITEQVKKAGIDVDTFKKALIETGKEHGVVTDKMIEEAGGFEKSLKSGWANSEIFSETFKNMQKTGKATEDMTKKLEYFQKVVDEVWNGDYGNTGVFDQNGEDRVKKLEKAGYDYKTVQDLVNKTVDGHKLTLEDLSEAQMKNLGFTEEQIKALKELQQQAKETGTPLNELIEDLTRPTDGGDLLWGSLFNTIKAFQKILGAIKGAWGEIFQLDAMSVYNVIKWLNGFTEKLIISDESADLLKRSLKGLFAIINAIVSVAGGAFKIAFQIVSGVLKVFDTNILEVTARIGDFLVKVAEWIKNHNYLAMGIEKLAEIIGLIIKKFHEWITAFLELPQVQEKITQFKNIVVKAFTTVKDFIVKAAKKIKDTIRGIGSGDGISFDWLKDIWAGIKKGFSAAFSGIGSALDAVKNFFKGFVNVVKSGAKGIGDVFNWIIDKVGAFVNFIKTKFANINLGNVIFAGIGVGTIVLMKKIINAFGGYAKILNGIGDILKGVGEVVDNFAKVVNGVKKVLTGYSWKLKAEAIRSMVVSILLLVGAIALLTFLDQGKLWSALGVMAAVAGGLVGFTFAMSKMNTSVDMLKISAFLFGVGSALMTMAMVIKILGGMNTGELIQGIIALTIMAGIIVGLLAATRLIATQVSTFEKNGIFKSKSGSTNGRGVAGIAGFLLSIAALMLVMSRVVKTLGRMSTGEMIQGLAAITALAGLIVGLMAATRLMAKSSVDGNAIKGVASTMLGIAGALLMMSQVVKRLGNMDVGVMTQGLVATTILSGLIVALLLAFRLIAKRQNGLDTKGIASTFIGIAGALLMLSMVVRILGGMDSSVLSKGITATYLLGGLIAALMFVTKYAQSGLKGVGSTMVGVGAALLAMTLAVRILGSMDLGSLAKGLIAVGFLGFIIAGLIEATSFGGSNAKKGLRGVPATLLAASLAIGILALSVGMLSLIEPDRLVKATIAIGMIASLFTGLIVATAFAKKCTGTIITLGITIALLAVAIGALSMIEPKNLAVAAGALSSVMYVFAIMTKMTGKVGKAIPTLAALTLVVGALAGIIYILAGLPVEGVLGSAVGLSMLMMSLAVVAKTTQHIMKFNAAAFGTMAALLAIVVGLAIIIGVLGALNVKPSLETAASLSLLMLSLAGVAVIIQAVRPEAALPGIAGFAIVVAGIGALLVALGALAQIPGLKWLINEGTQVLGAIGFAIGNFVGSIIGGFAAGATSGLPKVAENLSSFMTNLQPFIDNAKTLDSSALSGVKSLVEMILMLSVANLVDTFTSWLTGGSSIEKFSSQLDTFGKAIVGFSDIVKGKIDPTSVEAAANAGKMLAEMAKTIPNSGGVVGFFAGENDIDKFGEKLIPFAWAIVGFSGIVKGKVDGDAVEAAANAGKMMAEMAKTIPNSGGVVGFFAGENDLDKFAQQLVPFGEAIVQFSEIVDGNIDETAVEAAANAGTMMAEMASTIPNSGGLVSFFTGDNRLDEFGIQLASFGLGIATFSNILDQNGGINEKAVTAAANAGKMMAEMASTIPNTGGVVAFFTGDNRLDSFAMQLPLFGRAMADFSKEVSNSDIEDDTVMAAANAGKALAELYKELPKEGSCFEIFTGARDLAGFGSQLKDFGRAMADFSDEVSGNIDEGCITAAANAGLALAKMYDAIPTTGGVFEIFSGCKNMYQFGEDLADFGEAMAEFSEATDGIDVKTITPAAEAAKTLAEMTKAVPDSGGLWQWFTGAPDLEWFGDQLGNFGSAIKSFSDGISEGDGIDTKRVTAAANAGKIIAEMTQSGKLVEDFFTSENIDTFSKSLGLFGEAIVAFSDSISGENAINVEKVQNAVDAGTAIAELINSEDFKAVLSTKIDTTDGSLEGLKTRIKEIADLLIEFQKELGSEGILDTNKLKGAADACKKLAQLINSDDFKSLTGYEVKEGETTSLATVKERIVEIAGILKEFNDTLLGEGTDNVKVDTSLITNAVDACTEILKLLTSSKLSDLMNGDVLASFGEGGNLANLKTVAGHLGGIITSFNTELGTGDKAIDTGTVTSAVESCTEIIKLLTDDELAELMESTVLSAFGEGGSLANIKTVAQTLGGIIAAFNTELYSGENAANTGVIESAIDSCGEILGLLNSTNLTNLIDNGILTAFGEDGSLANIQTVATTLGGIISAFNTALGSGDTAIDVGKITDAIDACGEILEMLNSENFKNLVSMDYKEGGFSGLETQITEFGKAMKTMETTLSEINTEVITTASENIKSALDSMNSICTDGISKVVETLGNGETSVIAAVKDMCTASTDELDAQGDEFSTAGGNLATKIKEGAEDKQDDVTDAFEAIATAAAEATSSKTAYDAMYTVGEYLAKGLADGIIAYTPTAVAAATSMANQVEAASKAEFKEHSPSKVFFDIGAFVALGLVNGIRSYNTRVYDASAEMSGYATKGMSNAISKITSMIDSDMDTQPTIRPVLDLSNIESGAGLISGMFDNPSIGVVSNIGAISSMMNNRQNGANNDDVIAAIKNLGNKLGSTGGDTYSINGITYDDGTNVSDAVKTLVRAARMEGRR